MRIEKKPPPESFSSIFSSSLYFFSQQADNCLCTDFLSVKVSDFGSSREKSADEQAVMSAVVSLKSLASSSRVHASGFTDLLPRDPLTHRELQFLRLPRF